MNMKTSSLLVLSFVSVAATCRADPAVDAALADAYVRDAKRIISLWGPPVEDYSARLWNGVVRSYCLPRLEIYWRHRGLGRDAVLDSSPISNCNGLLAARRRTRFVPFHLL